MKFSRQAFNAHIDNIGQDVLWMRSWACPCMDRNTGSPKPSCPICVGRGRVWDTPVEMVMGIASQSTQIKWAKMGQWEHGDMVVVIPENCLAWDYGGQYDRFITQEGLDGFSEVLVRGAPTERLRVPVHEVFRCFWIDPTDKTKVVEGGLPVIDANGRPSWPNGGEPPLGTSYSVTGDRFSEYFLVDAYPDDRNEHRGMRLPKRVVLRKWDLYGRAARTSSY
ncbi:hypothetical protein N7563_22010 [Leclercia adecarboxylata ATCC 23216 = NBRC 102595]|nr:hypothetical protein [Leclercia adecarboxylata ATCC 23216 = NBRC 102595]